jgi:hypothetical protein
MRPQLYAADDLRQLLHAQKVATLPQLQSVLGAQGRMTVFRKLKALSYLSSYSHAGRYYTLPDIARFNEQGLWFWNDIRFSKRRTLKQTLERWVEESPAGYFDWELEQQLHVAVRGTLIKLIGQERIAREKISGRYLYVAQDLMLRHAQLAARRDQVSQSEPGYAPPGPEILHHEMKASIVLFFSLLNEKQRRVYAGLESLKLGRGGDAKIAQLLSLNVRTIAKGREELLKRDVKIEGIRKAGAGRPLLEKKRQKS